MYPVLQLHVSSATLSKSLQFFGKARNNLELVLSTEHRDSSPTCQSNFSFVMELIESYFCSRLGKARDGSLWEIVGITAQRRVRQPAEECYSNVSAPQHMSAIGERDCKSVIIT